MEFYVDPTPPACKGQKGVTLLDKWIYFAAIVADPELGNTDKLTAFSLLSFLNNRSGLCCPHVATIAKGICAHERTVKRSLANLRKRGWLLVRRRRSSPLYTFAVPPEMPNLAPLDVPNLAPLNTGTSTRGKSAKKGTGLSTYSEQEVRHRGISTCSEQAERHMATVTVLADHRPKKRGKA